MDNELVAQALVAGYLAGHALPEKNDMQKIAENLTEFFKLTKAELDKFVNDGELGKSNFSRSTRERRAGFVERRAGADFKPTSIFGRDMVECTDYFNRGGRTAIGHHDNGFKSSMVQGSKSRQQTESESVTLNGTLNIEP